MASDAKPGRSPHRRIAVVVNPAAGRGRARGAADRIDAHLRAASQRDGDLSDCRVTVTSRPGHAAELAAQAAQDGFAIVAAAGGDGTVSEVARAIRGTNAALGILPLGTGNDLARHIGIPLALPAAVALLSSGIPRPLDVGRANGLTFVNAVGCGFDAEVADRVNRGLRFLGGTVAYVGAVAQSLAGLRAASVTVSVDATSVTTPAVLVAVGNSRSYGGGMQFAPDARLDDGLLDVCVVGDVGRTGFVRAFPRVYKGTHVTHPDVAMLRGRHITIVADPPWRSLVDGEVVGRTPLEVTVERHALRVIAPEEEQRGH